jgi:hypothetical protein
MLNIPLVIVPDEEIADAAEVLVDAAIDGRAYRFVLDSGAARTELVADDDLAALPASGQRTSGAVFGQRESSDIIIVGDLSLGELRTGPLEVVRVSATDGRRHLIGMDLLSRYCCEFRFADQQLILTDSPPTPADLDLQLAGTNHIYVRLCWDDVTASTVWDSGAGISAVDQAFAAAHPELFAPAGESAGTDASLNQQSVPLLTMAGPVIAGVGFAPSTVAVIDLGAMNQGLEIPIEIIAGYPLLHQADWLFDIPAGRFAAPRLLRP